MTLQCSNWVLLTRSWWLKQTTRSWRFHWRVIKAWPDSVTTLLRGLHIALEVLNKSFESLIQQSAAEEVDDWCKRACLRLVASTRLSGDRGSIEEPHLNSVPVAPGLISKTRSARSKKEGKVRFFQESCSLVRLVISICKALTKSMSLHRVPREANLHPSGTASHRH
jgi:hypothetical protein